MLHLDDDGEDAADGARRACLLSMITIATKPTPDAVALDLEVRYDQERDYAPPRQSGNTILIQAPTTKWLGSRLGLLEDSKKRRSSLNHVI